MNDIVIVKTQKKRSFYYSKPVLTRIAEYDVFSVKHRISSLKFVADYSGGRYIVADEETAHNKKFEKYIKEYNEYDADILLSVLEKIVLCVAKKFNIKLPFSEVYIVDTPHNAAKIIENIKNCSGLFTVISDDYSSDAFEELYFKYGIVIRQIPEQIYKNNKNAIVIKGGGECRFFDCGQIPVIDLNAKKSEGMCVAASNVYIYDEKIKGFLKSWGGVPSIKIYSLLGTFPQKNAIIDINKAADDIFLLDTEKI